MSGSTGVSKQASLRPIFLSLPFLPSCSVDTLWCMARPYSAAVSPQYLKTTLKLRGTLRLLCTPFTAHRLMETRDESPWNQALLLLPSDPVRSLGFPTPIGIIISSAGNSCEAAALPPPHDEGVKARGNNLLLPVLLLVIVSCFLAGTFPVWLCCFLLQFGILLPYYSLPVKADASLLPGPLTVN